MSPRPIPRFWEERGSSRRDCSSPCFWISDESIHLAAGLQFAGVRSAVATLWTVDDSASAFVADRMYGHMMREGMGEPNPSEAAEALHRAVGAIEAAGRPMVYWVPFIHTGR